MKTIELFCLGSALLVLSAHATAQESPTTTPIFYVCTLKGGLKQFQDRPCAVGQKQITNAEFQTQRDQQATRAKQEATSPWLETVAEIVLGGVASANARKSSSVSEKPTEPSRVAGAGSGKSSTSGYRPITPSASAASGGEPTNIAGMNTLATNYVLPVPDCLVLEAGKPGQLGGSQSLRNICSFDVEATWSDPGSSNLSNSWPIPAGGTYPVKAGYITYNACPSRSTIARKEGGRIWCSQ